MRNEGKHQEWTGVKGPVGGPVEMSTRTNSEADPGVAGNGKVSAPLSFGQLPGYRNGYGNQLRLTLGNGTVEMRWPRVSRS